MRFLVMSLCLLAAMGASAETPSINGQYLEVRSCDVYTGSCFANGEMGQAGKEAILVWKITEGEFNDSTLDGLSVMAVVRVADTLGDLSQDPQDGRAALLVDERATKEQREALVALARDLGGNLIKEVKSIEGAPMEINIGACDKSGCASAKAGNLVDISTRCLNNGDHVCGNESAFYPPLTQTANAYPAYTEVAAWNGESLGATWSNANTRSAFIATFSR